jgi:paraquat-inducible protein A
VCEAPPAASHRTCPRCGAKVHARKPDAVGRCWALLLAATALYIPANLLPVTRTRSFFGEQSDTILSGIVYLWLDGSWPLALLVFIASIVVPLSKLVILSYLLISVQRHSRHAPQHRLRLYRLLEIVGRWSMLDVYVVTLLAALVQIQALARITPGPGAVAFGAVVVLTMLATQCFDPRAIWDPLDPATHPQTSS